MFDIYPKLPVGDRLFIDSIIEDHPAIPNFYYGMKVQEVVDAATQSHKNNSWVVIKK